MSKIPATVYIGYNSFRGHKRGVENVVLSQIASSQKKAIYLSFDKNNQVFKYTNILCITLKYDALIWFRLVALFFLLKQKYIIKIHSHNFIVSLLLPYKTDILTVHDGLFYLRQAIKHRFRFIHYLIEKVVYARSSLIHFISHYTLTNSLYRGTKYKIISNTTPLELLADKSNVNPYINYASDVIKIFAVRGIEERTRIDLLIEFAERCALIAGKKYHIFIAGKGRLLSYYQDIIIQKNIQHVHLLGFISDEELGNYYKFCDMVIVPAEYGEGFGLPIIEGYLFDKPVIASNVCAIPEVIQDKSNLFENNIISLSAAIEQVLAKQQNQHLNKYKNYYFSKFSAEIIKKQYQSMYAEVES